jgi:hypothetical protein
LNAVKPATEQEALTGALKIHVADDSLEQPTGLTSDLTGLTFDPDTGGCTTPGKVEMESQVKERW